MPLPTMEGLMFVAAMFLIGVVVITGEKIERYLYRHRLQAYRDWEYDNILELMDYPIEQRLKLYKKHTGKKAPPKRLVE